MTRLQRILPPNMRYFVRQKVQISSKILPQILNFVSLRCTILICLLNFIKFRQKTIFSSRRPVFVISSVFRQKRNPLEPIHELDADSDRYAMNSEDSVRCDLEVTVPR